ncbi:excinuclease ABC subunit UvrA [Patescibacteria group bacterium]|nr:excinuclease ABC subunit UvrA [Patescibacteria group bacterium]
MSTKFIEVNGSRVHNLKNVSVKIPKNKLTVITGLSGSGKSSLAFDTIYAEGQRRYAESLNAYARQFMEVQDKPDVDEIKGLSPTIAIDQKNVTQNPRSTVGTSTEVYDLLRLLFSRIGKQYCPDCHKPVQQHTVGEITELVRKMGRDGGELLILSPLISGRTVLAKDLLAHIEPSGYDTVRVNGVLMTLTNLKKYAFDKDKVYDIELLITKISDIKKQNLSMPIDKAIDLSNGSIVVVNEESGDENTYTLFPICQTCGRKFEDIEPRSFSFNSPYGACPRCTGLGYTLDVDAELVIPNPRLTLAEGAVQPWTRIVGNQSHYQKLLNVVADSHGFSVNTPVKDLPSKVMDILFYGTDGQVYEVGSKKIQFEGIVPNLTQRHAETESEYIRKEIEGYMREKICPVCLGKRLKSESLSIKIGEWSIADVVEMTVEEAYKIFGVLAESKTKDPIKKQLTSGQISIAMPVAKEINTRLKNLLQVGLYYLALDRSITTLSGGEAQRIRLSTQLSTGLTDVIYILDEPSIGLHPKDNDKLIETLRALCDAGNTVIVVEHDSAMMESADYLIDMGPGAGAVGGEVVSAGTPASVKKDKNSLTGQYLTGVEKISAPKKIKKGSGKNIEVIGATVFNLKNLDVKFPLGKFICVSGVSGSGKSSLISNILSRALHKKFYRSKAEPGEHKKITGVNNIDKVITIDQRPIGRTPRSNPATYTGVFTAIRDLFTNVPEARMRGLSAGMFSFNVKGGGRCEACAGDGYIRIPMQFLTDVYVECSECNGKRYTKEALEIHYRQKNISDVLQMTVNEAYTFFNDTSNIADKLNILREVGLGYLKLGQPATTLSGGEAQRIKLATELSRRSTGKTLYILDEPTTGLHFDDIKRLLNVLHKLVDKGNTILIIEHNLDVIKSSDWVIDLGPEGGKRGGEVVAQGAPKDVAKVAKSWTGRYLKEILKK